MKDIEFYKHLVILVGLYLGRMAFSIANCYPFNEQGEQFSIKKLLLGVIKNAIVLGGISVVYWAGLNFGEDLAVISLGESTFTIQTVLDMLIIAAIGIYGTKFMSNVKDYFSVTQINELAPIALRRHTDESDEESSK